MNEEMNFEHLSNDTFPQTESFTAEYEKPVWKMDLKEVEQELMPLKAKELNNQKLDQEEQFRKDKLIERKTGLS